MGICNLLPGLTLDLAAVVCSPAHQDSATSAIPLLLGLARQLLHTPWPLIRDGVGSIYLLDNTLQAGFGIVQIRYRLGGLHFYG